MQEVEHSDERLFLLVVEAGSLTAVARRVGANASTVSRRLARLEEKLGVKLLQRSTRRSTPTDAGARYYAGLRRLVDEQQALEAEVSGASEVPHGLLRVTAPVDFGARFVVPVVEALQADAPELQVQLVLGSGFMDLAEHGIDVAVRIGRLPDSALIAKRLGAVPRVLVGAPAYLDRRGRPRCLADLAEHDFVLYSPGRLEASFEVGLPAGGSERVLLRGRVSVNSVTGIRHLVEAGAGLHLGPRWAAEEGLAAGRVEELLADHRLPAFPLHALYRPTPWVPAKIRAFVDGLAAHLRQQPALQC